MGAAVAWSVHARATVYFRVFNRRGAKRRPRARSGQTGRVCNASGVGQAQPWKVAPGGGRHGFGVTQGCRAVPNRAVPYPGGAARWRYGPAVTDRSRTGSHGAGGTVGAWVPVPDPSRSQLPLGHRAGGTGYCDPLPSLLRAPVEPQTWGGPPIPILHPTHSNPAPTRGGSCARHTLVGAGLGVVSALPPPVQNDCSSKEGGEGEERCVFKCISHTPGAPQNTKGCSAFAGCSRREGRGVRCAGEKQGRVWGTPSPLPAAGRLWGRSWMQGMC